MAVSETFFIWIAGSGVAALGTLSAAVYYNRRKIMQLWQRLFGLEGDDSDEGYLIEMDAKIDRRFTELAEQMDEQHEQVFHELKTLKRD